MLDGRSGGGGGDYAGQSDFGRSSPMEAPASGGGMGRELDDEIPF
jgi:hypothetical protein